jgi:multidrug resistance efflux pump
MNVVIDDLNYKQVAQAMYENVKSNQKRIDIMEPTLKKMAAQIEQLNALLVRNGFAKAVETNTKELKDFRAEFQDFKTNREESCPVAKRNKEELEKERSKRNWKATATRLVFGGIGTVSTLIIIFEKIIS